MTPVSVIVVGAVITWAVAIVLLGAGWLAWRGGRALVRRLRKRRPLPVLNPINDARNPDDPVTRTLLNPEDCCAEYPFCRCEANPTRQW